MPKYSIMICLSNVSPIYNRQISKGQTVYYHYAFFLELADEPFDSSRLRNKAEKTMIAREGSDEYGTIVGVDVALSSMKRREVARFLIQSLYAFGDCGQY